MATPPPMAVPKIKYLNFKMRDIIVGTNPMFLEGVEIKFKRFNKSIRFLLNVLNALIFSKIIRILRLKEILYYINYYSLLIMITIVSKTFSNNDVNFHK